MLSQDEQWLLREKYAGVESEAFHADLKRLQAGEPLGYVIGWIPFLNCQIHLDSRPLIPRPETEYWLEKAIKEILKQQSTKNLSSPEEDLKQSEDDGSTQVRGPNSNLKILDLCAGSGAIGVAVAKDIPEAHVTFGEIDKAHLPTIQRNIKENLSNGTIIYDSEKYQVIESDLFENISGQFDFILTNPPYIDTALDRAEESVKNHEPHLALYGGKTGMEIVSKIIYQAKQFLKPGGQLWIEHEPEQTNAISLLAHEFGFSPTSYKDQYQTIRYSVLMLQ